MKSALGRQLAEHVGWGLEAGICTAACYEVCWHGERLARGERGALSARSRFPATRTTLFDMASLTKPMATALAVLRLVADGRISFETTLEELLPVLGGAAGPLDCHPRLASATLHNLLTHTSGISAWESLYKRGLSRRGFVEAILTTPPKHEPATVYEYSCLGYIVLGEVVAAVAGEPLDGYVRRVLHRPAGMRHTRYRPAPAQRRRAAATELCPWRGKRARGIVHDENAYSLGGVSGNAGLFSTARDVSRFCRALLDRRPPFASLPPRLYRAYTANQLKALGFHSSCGWFTYASDMLYSPPGFSRRTFGHTGFTGTSVLIDPARNAYAFLLTNRVYYGREFQRYGDWRRQFYHTVGAFMQRGRA